MTSINTFQDILDALNQDPALREQLSRHILTDELLQLPAADVVLSGRTAWEGPRYVIIEASITVQRNDVLTAKKRAAVLQKVSDIITIPAVVGVLITEEAKAETDMLFIEYNPGDQFTPADSAADAETDGAPA